MCVCALRAQASELWIQRMLQLVKSEKRAAVRKQWLVRARNLEPEICRLFGYIDADGSNAIDLPEFLKAAADAGLHDERKLEALFRRKDADGNGVLDVAEFIECARVGTARAALALADACNAPCGLASPLRAPPSHHLARARAPMRVAQPRGRLPAAHGAL